MQGIKNDKTNSKMTGIFMYTLKSYCIQVLFKSPHSNYNILHQ